MNPDATYDVAIIGAGPAGSAAAIELARAGARVLLIEKSAFPRHKVCGEFLSPEVAGILDELGCGAMLDSAPRMDLARVHTASRQMLQFPLTSPAFGLSRRALDDGLAKEAVRRGVTFLQKTEIASVADGLLTARDGRTFSARVVIPAWGRQSKEGGQFFGFKAHFVGDYPPRVDLHFIAGGYIGVSPVEDGRINVCALVDKRRIKDAEAIAQQALRASFPDAASGDSVFPQDWPFLFTGPLHPGWQGGAGLAVGDAAAFLDPFTGDGISLALRSGRLAARAALELLNDWDKRSSDTRTTVRTYRAELRRMCRGQFALAGLLRFGAHRSWLEAPVSRLLAANPGLRRAVFGITRGKVGAWGGSGRK